MILLYLPRSSSVLSRLLLTSTIAIITTTSTSTTTYFYYCYYYYYYYYYYHYFKVSNGQYKAFLERIVENDMGYEEIGDILNRHNTLTEANNDLMRHSAEVRMLMIIVMMMIVMMMMMMMNMVINIIMF